MLFLITVVAYSVATPQSIEKLLAQSKYDRAYQEASSVITQEGILNAAPVLFYLRGQAGYRLGKYEEAVNDMSRFLRSGKANQKESKTAYLYRGFSYLRTGNLQDAEVDASTINDPKLKQNIKNATLLHGAAKDFEKEGNLKQAFDRYQRLLKISTACPKFMGGAARVALALGNTTYFNDMITKALARAPRDPELLELRGRYLLSTTDYLNAQKHLKLCISTASNPNKCTALLKSMNSFQSNEKKARDAITAKDYDTAKVHIAECKKVNDLVGVDDSKLSLAITALEVKILIAQNKKEEAVKLLDKLIKASPNNNELLIQRGEVLMSLGDYDGALTDFQVVRDRTKNNQKVINLINKAAELQKKEKDVDYYTLLGVTKRATEDEIKSAYKKAVVKWHPDRYRDTFKKKEAEKKMKMINKAYDVLSDQKKRRLYDMGQDPENAGANMGHEQGAQPNGGYGGYGGFNSFNMGGGGMPDLGDIFGSMFGSMFGGGMRGNAHTRFTTSSGSGRQQQQQQQRRQQQQQRHQERHQQQRRTAQQNRQQRRGY